MAHNSENNTNRWVPRQEHEMTRYGSSDSVVIDIPDETEVRFSERTFLRPKLKLLPTSTAKRVVGFIGAVFVISLIGYGFTSVYRMTGRGAGTSDHPKVDRSPKALILPDTSHLAYVNADKPLADEARVSEYSTTTGDTIAIPLKISQSEPKSAQQNKTEKNIIIPNPSSPSVKIEEQSTVKSLVDSTSTTTSKNVPVSSSSTAPAVSTPETEPTIRRPTHKPRPLPDNPHDKDAVSLLYQLKLVNNTIRINNLMNFTQCVDENDNKTHYKGWKASFSVSSSLVHLDPGKNLFIGYGSDKQGAKQMAAQRALMAIYPGQIEYAIDETQVTEISPFCL